MNIPSKLHGQNGVFEANRSHGLCLLNADGRVGKCTRVQQKKPDNAQEKSTSKPVHDHVPDIQFGIIRYSVEHEILSTSPS
jgi:hypothetical protein